MLRKYLYIFIMASIILPGQSLAAESISSAAASMRDEINVTGDNAFERGSALYLGEPGRGSYNGRKVTASLVKRQDHGLVLPDGNGGVIIIPGAESAAQNPNVVDARELKLKIRELASQLVTGLNANLANHIALPTAFVQQDDFDRSSSFGRFMAEQLFYEFNQRGLRTREYRLGQNLSVREDGEFILTRNIEASPLATANLYVVGTYFTDGQVLFLNARLLRANGEIVRTGQLIMQVNPLTRRMLANSGRKMPGGSLEVKDFNTEARPPATVTAFDQGLDVH